MRLFRLPARRRLSFELNSSEALCNLNALARTNQKKMPHHDTVAYLMERVPLEGMRWLRDHIVRRLLRSRALEKFRLADHYYLVALDGTGFVSFRHRHCPHCLKREYPGGNTIYYHPVLEAKLVCRNGLAISIGTEFIEKPDPEAKEDCELNAFYRLIPRVREAFPRLPICLLLDALYLNQTVMDLCEDHRLEWITTFKKGSLPDAYREFQALQELAPENQLHTERKGITRIYRWMNDMTHKGHTFSAFECVEKKKDQKKSTRFLWATSLRVSKRNIEHLSLQGGRLRWKIENEGFNVQKNRGFGLGHPYSENWNAAKAFYIALQIAHLIDQIISNSNLLGDSPAALFGSGEAFALRLLEAWRNFCLSAERLNQELSRRYQIRLHGY